MAQRVVAIGLDSADPDLLDHWIRQGHLPNIARLKESGFFCRFENTVKYAGGEAPYTCTEGSWVSLQTGVKSTSTGYWETVGYDSQKYDATNDPVHGGYSFEEFPPFFALEDALKVVSFDVPVTAVCPKVNGKQIVGWGGHFPFVKRGSEPPELLDEITEKYGQNDILYNDYGVFWNEKYLRWLEETSIKCIETRAEACIDLMNSSEWDLFIAVFGETHGAGHDLYFASDPSHPVHQAWKGDHDPLLSVFTAVDDAIGKVYAEVPDDVYFVCFSAHGMQANQTDMTNFFLLPEIMYRYNFPGRIGFSSGKESQPLREPFLKGLHWYWFGEIWRRRHSKFPLTRALRKLLPGWLVWPPGKDMKFPYLLDWFGAEVGWMPSVWYKPAWPRMRSFSLPAFADGHIRINLVGRESNGLVTREEYTAECAKITEMLLRVTNARTGKPIVKDVVRTRNSADDMDPRLPHADLVVLWEDEPMDVIDSEDVGRIGPVPYYRTGGHRNVGFMVARGPGIERGAELPTAQAIDFGPTILRMLNKPIADRLEGRCLVDLRQTTAAPPA